MEWIKLSKYNLPPQGLKIVCFRKGDVWIARRLVLDGKSYWIEIPYGGNGGAISTDAPDYWMKMDLPEDCTGFMKIGVDGEPLMTLDELQEKYPESHREFVEMMISTIDKKKNAPIKQLATAKNIMKRNKSVLKKLAEENHE